MTEKKAKRSIDWDLIEVDYRAGVKSLRQMAEEHGITHGAVNKHAKEHGWARDLAAKIRAQADAKVSKAVVSAEVSAAKVVTEQAVVEANAELQYRIRMEHRRDIQETRTLFGDLLGELKSATAGKATFDAILETADKMFAAALESNADRAELSATRSLLSDVHDSFRKLTNIGSRIDNAKKLTEMLEKLVRMEREAFGIKEDEQESSVDDLLKRVRAEMTGG